MKEHFYYSLGDRTKIYVSNSLLSALDKDLDGSPQKCKDFIEGELTQKETLSLENGSLIHAYSEHKDSFIIEASKPAEQTEKLCQYLFENYIKAGNEPTPFDINNSIDALNIYGNTKDETKRLAKFEKDGGYNYLEYLKNSEGKIAVTAAQETVILGAIDSLENNETISKYLFAEDTDTVKTYKEIAITFKAKVPVKEKYNQSGYDPVVLNFKILIDNLTVDYKNKAVINTDLKTTGKSIDRYASTEDRVGSFEYWRTYRQLSIYHRALQLLINGKATAIDNNGMPVEFIFPEPEKWKRYAQIAAVETHGYYRSRLFPIGEDWLERGEEEARDLMQTLAWHIQSGVWDQTPEDYYLNGKSWELQTVYRYEPRRRKS